MTAKGGKKSKAMNLDRILDAFIEVSIKEITRTLKITYYLEGKDYLFLKFLNIRLSINTYLLSGNWSWVKLYTSKDVKKTIVSKLM